MADTATHEDFSKMKVADLKKLLKSKSLSTTGTKSDLVERLKLSMSTSESEEDKNTDVREIQVKDVEPEQEVPVLEKADKKPITIDTTSITKTENTVEEPTSPTVITPPTSDEERLKKRAERFGAVSEDSKKLMRAERFGVVSEDLKKQQRAARFGVSGITSPTQTTNRTTSSDDVDKLKERAKRFGQVLSSSLSKVDEDERIKKRKERFGDVTAATNNKPAKFAKVTYNSPDDDMKKKRAERFGLS